MTTPTYTYGNDPAGNTSDAVRFWINDVGPTVWEFSDQEIAYSLTLYPNPVLAAAYLANRLAMKYSAYVDKSVGDLRIANSQRAKMYLELSEQLKSQSEQTNVTIYVGGVSRSNMQAVASNSDRVRQPFTITQFDIPGSAEKARTPGEGCE